MNDVTIPFDRVSVDAKETVQSNTAMLGKQCFDLKVSPEADLTSTSILKTDSYLENLEDVRQIKAKRTSKSSRDNSNKNEEKDCKSRTENPKSSKAAAEKIDASIEVLVADNQDSAAGSDSSHGNSDSSMKTFLDSEDFEAEEPAPKPSSDWRSNSNFRPNSSLHRERRLSSEKNKHRDSRLLSKSTEKLNHMESYKSKYSPDVPLLPKRRRSRNYDDNNSLKKQGHNFDETKDSFTMDRPKSRRELSKSLESIVLDDSDDYSMLMKKHGLKQGLNADQDEAKEVRRRPRIPSALLTSHSDSEDVVLVTEPRRRQGPYRGGSKSTPITPRDCGGENMYTTTTGPPEMMDVDDDSLVLQLPLSGRSTTTERPKGTARPRSSVESDPGESCDSGISISDSRYGVSILLCPISILKTPYNLAKITKGHSIAFFIFFDIQI